MRTYKTLSKIILSLMIIYFCQTSAVHAGGKNVITIKGGLSHANQSWAYTRSALNFKEKYRNGFRIGVFVDRSFAGFASYRIGLNFMQLGSKEERQVVSVDNPDIIGYYDLDRRLDYLSIPLDLKLSVKLMQLPTYIYAGPSVNFLVNRSPHAESLDFDKMTFGGEIGMGQEFSILRDLPVFLVEIYYYHDFNNTLEDSFLKITSHSLGIVAGFKF